MLIDARNAELGNPVRADVCIIGAELNPKNNNGETPMRVAEGTIVTVMVFIHEDVAEVLGELGGVSEGIHPSFLAAQEAAAQEEQPDP